jgi:hypothetical protein
MDGIYIKSGDLERAGGADEGSGGTMIHAHENRAHTLMYADEE